jgi:hypothetical protein
VPLYYFNIYNDDVTLDDEGAELPDAEAAAAHGIREVRALAADTASRGHLTRSHRVEIVDHDRVLIDTIRFDDAVDIRD